MSIIKTLLLLLALLCAFHPSPLCEAAVCYVKPTEPHNATCPSEPCYTLDEYVSNSTRYFVSNAVFMFLTGNHHLSSNLTVSEVHNITLRPYIEKSDVVIDSELMQLLVIELASSIIIRGMTFQTLSIWFENSTNVTLTGLTAQNDTALFLNNVFGEVDISLQCELSDIYNACIAIEWTVTRGSQAQYTPDTVVLLHGLELRGSTVCCDNNNGVFITGCIPGKIILVNSTITAKNGIYMDIAASCKEMLFVCENTHFQHGAEGLYIAVQTPLHRKYTMAVALHNVSFTDNYIAIDLQNTHNVTISDSYFRSSFGGAIRATNSILSLMGNVTFIDNQGTYGGGGAIALGGGSRILIPEPNNTYILFENNISNVGGAIYVSNSDTDVIGYCNMYVEQIPRKIVFNFTMNTAVYGGNAIYGANLEAFPCYSPNGTLIQNISQLILSVSSFSPSFADDPSVISSDALSVCFCNEDGELGNCLGSNNTSVYPGQVFRLPVAALGDMNGLVKWQVYAAVDQGEFSKETQHSQISSAESCVYFQYSVLSNSSWDLLYFSLTSFQENSVIQYFYGLDLLDCPLAFSLSASGGCECHETLSQNIENVTCNITEQSIQRQGTIWIGVLEENDISNATLAFSNVCPFLYCNESSVKIHIYESFIDADIQCTDNHSGVLCGGCKDNFSLALGSNRCLHGCSNNSLSLIIAFAAAGIALVFFIKILNLTVSQGTINGLMFYANIIGAEQTVLFSSNTRFLSVFTAWVNLDLGIETCFFDRMDAYTKAWLQFVFPAYVWAITLFIIILSHYSIRASKLFGNNSVPVLATLILLSYSKLLRAVISALSITDIQFLDGSTMSVWERDGNIQYLTGKHIPLFVFAIAVLVLLWLPFTLVLVSIQWLQRETHYRVLCWVTKLRPFFDAFTGPLKDKHRYWVGALLLARCSLLLVFYIYTANGSGIAFISINFTTVIILVILAATGSVYRNYYLTILELSYIFNLGMLAIGTLYVWYNSGNLEALVITSVSIAFLQFMVTVIYHACVQLREPLMKFQFTATMINQLGELVMKLKDNFLKIGGQEDEENINGPEHEEYEPLDGVSDSVEPLQRPPFQEIPNFREPLLGYLND